MQHTPAPWHIVDRTEVRGKGSRIICDTALHRIDANTAADAALIAAAPTMLEALRAADKWVAMYHDQPGHDAASRCMSGVIRAAIAAATKDAA